MKHQRQKIACNVLGTLHFVENKIISRLVREHAGLHGEGLNDLCARTQRGEFDPEDYNQILQMIGYSVAGYDDARLDVPPESIAHLPAKPS